MPATIRVRAHATTRLTYDFKRLGMRADDQHHNQDLRNSGYLEFRKSDMSEIRMFQFSGIPELRIFRNSKNPDFWNFRKSGIPDFWKAGNLEIKKSGFAEVHNSWGRPADSQKYFKINTRSIFQDQMVKACF